VAKHVILTLSFLTLFTTTSPALAAREYVSLSFGGFAMDYTNTIDRSGKAIRTNYSPGVAVSATYGFKLEKNFRLESEIAYRSVSRDAWTFGWMINGWYDFANNSRYTPYLGGGAGFGRGHADSPGMVDNSLTGIAYQGGAGVVIGLRPNLDLDLGYRYFGITAGSSNGVDSIAGSTVQAGVRLSF
jgi:opacity protein-like surface antigen